MSKSTKIIAALGVVAGLGVAALPAFTYAQGTASVTGNADVYVEINPAIAMTIVGNNDDTATADQQYTTNPVSTGVDVFSPASGNPSSVDGHNRPDPQTTLSSSYTAIYPGVVSDDATFKSTVTVYTNAANGYNLKMRATSSKTVSETPVAALLNQADDGATYIPTGTTAAGTAAWSYTTTRGEDTSAETTFSLTDATLATTDEATSGGDVTDVNYKVSTANDQATGVYKGSLIYTATTNNQ